MTPTTTGAGGLNRPKDFLNATKRIRVVSLLYEYYTPLHHIMSSLTQCEHTPTAAHNSCQSSSLCCTSLHLWMNGTSSLLCKYHRHGIVLPEINFGTVYVKYNKKKHEVAIKEQRFLKSKSFHSSTKMFCFYWYLYITKHALSNSYRALHPSV